MYDPQQRQLSGRKLSDPKNLSPTFPDQQRVNVSFGAHEIIITASVEQPKDSPRSHLAWDWRKGRKGSVQPAVKKSFSENHVELLSSNFINIYFQINLKSRLYQVCVSPDQGEVQRTQLTQDSSSYSLKRHAVHRQSLVELRLWLRETQVKS